MLNLGLSITMTLLFEADQNTISPVQSLNHNNWVSAKKEFANPEIMANFQKSFNQ